MFSLCVLQFLYRYMYHQFKNKPLKDKFKPLCFLWSSVFLPLRHTDGSPNTPMPATPCLCLRLKNRGCPKQRASESHPVEAVDLAVPSCHSPNCLSPHRSGVTWGRTLNASGPWFAHLQNGVNTLLGNSYYIISQGCFTNCHSQVA